MDTEGLFLDPQGRIMPLRAGSPEAFRVLVTRKLEQGWRRVAASPPVVPLKHEEVWGIAPIAAPEPAASMPAMPTAKERDAAFLAAVESSKE